MEMGQAAWRSKRAFPFKYACPWRGNHQTGRSKGWRQEGRSKSNKHKPRVDKRRKCDMTRGGTRAEQRTAGADQRIRLHAPAPAGKRVDVRVCSPRGGCRAAPVSRKPVRSRLPAQQNSVCLAYRCACVRACMRVCMCTCTFTLSVSFKPSAVSWACSI